MFSDRHSDHDPHHLEGFGVAAAVLTAAKLCQRGAGFHRPRRAVVDLRGVAGQRGVLLLHGIGDSGDNANPTSNSLSNKNPQHQAHTITVSVYNTTNQLVINKLGTITYNPDDGDYTGVVPMGTTLTTGDYTIKIKADSYLQKRIPAIVHIVPATTMNMPTVSLIAGETTGDNVISILDYNMLLGCYSDLLPPTFCDANKQVLTDLNDDGNVNQIDYNLFLREITVQNGD